MKDEPQDPRPRETFSEQIKNHPTRLLIGNLLHFYYDEEHDAIATTDQGGFILTRDEFEELVENIRAWYATLTDEEIEEHNRGRLERISPAPMRAAKEKPPRPARPARPGQVYLARADQNLYKIGFSRNAALRVKNLTVQLPYKQIELIHVIEAADMVLLERQLHERFQEKRHAGEWFSLDDEDVAWIKAYREPANE